MKHAPYKDGILLATDMSQDVIFIELVVASVNVNPIIDRLVVCGGSDFPGGDFLINCDGRFKADWLPVGGS